MNTKRDKPSRSPGRRLVRYLTLGLLNLLVLVVVVALAAPLLFDPNDYKDTIAREVKARTGRDLTITGDMQLSVLPWLGVTVGEIRLGNAPGFGEEPFARLDSAQVRVKLLPLINREVRMDTVSVQGLALNLIRDEAGRGNWEDRAGLAAGDKGDGAEGKAIAAFALGGVRVEDAAASYTDAVTGEQLGLTDVDLHTGAVQLGEPVDAELSLRFSHPQAMGRLTGKARLHYDLSAARYGADGIDMTLETQAPGVSDGTTRARLTGAVTYDEGARLLMARTVALAVDAPALPGSGLSGDTALSAAGDVDWRIAEQTLASPALTITVPGLRHGY